MKDRFNFKQFCIRQDKCAMKVGTDGVLLGAWAPGGKHILDIGTGTGIMALMMAQRYADATIDGIDIDAEACWQAKENAMACHFGQHINIYESRLQDWFPPYSYDAIVSNPPFFINALRNPDTQRSMARHTDTLSPRDLFQHAHRLLSSIGLFSIIIPTNCLDSFVSESIFAGFYLLEKINIKTVPHKGASRSLLTFSKSYLQPTNSREETLVDASGQKTEWYAHLTCDFYL